MKRLYTILISFLLLQTSCSDFVDIEPPRTDLVRETIFQRDETAEAAMQDIYFRLSTLTGYASGSFYSVSFLSALSSDDAVNFLATLTDIQQFNDNEILSNNLWTQYLWSDMYRVIYRTNAMIEGLQQGTVSESLKQQLLGEAKFIRAFTHFYLINLYGDAPLVLTTDYRINQHIARTPVATVYEQIIADLLEAQQLLPEDYSGFEEERIRITRPAATAMLSRVYLYTGQWEKAEIEATKVIEDETLFELVPLAQVFLKNNREGIWQMPGLNGGATNDYLSGLIYSRLTPSLISAFEVSDSRGFLWKLGNIAYKYKSSGTTEYSVVLRLGEQYLIRAEARAQLDDIEGAQADINAIRVRAGLSETTTTDKDELLEEIMQERRVELFMEWGHRWLDLKRWGKADEVLSGLKPNWQETDVYYPIPDVQLLNDPAMTDDQNPGYQ